MGLRSPHRKKMLASCTEGKEEEIYNERLFIFLKTYFIIFISIKLLLPAIFIFKKLVAHPMLPY